MELEMVLKRNWNCKQECIYFSPPCKVSEHLQLVIMSQMLKPSCEISLEKLSLQPMWDRLGISLYDLFFSWIVQQQLVRT